jgi:FixJ family two-component response regulator
VRYSADIKAPTRPSEGNNRLTMIADIRSSFYSLKKTEQQLLEALYRDGGLDVEIVAVSLDVHPRTVKRREARVMDKMVERLGGESPFLR